MLYTYVLGCGKNMNAEVLRAETSSPAYHIQLVKDVFRLWNSHEVKEID